MDRFVLYCAGRAGGGRGEVRRRAGAAQPGGSLRLCCLAAGARLAGLLAACSSPSPTATAHTVSLDTDGRTQATLEVLTGTTVLEIGMADLGTAGSLLRVVTPPGAPAAQLRTDGTAGGSVVDLTAGNAPTVTVTLNTRVSWRLELGGGTSRTSADLRRGQVTGIAFTAGSSVISLALPRPRGIVPVQLAGGASEFPLSLPSGVPAQVTAGGGAGEVSLEGADHVGVAGRVGIHHPGLDAGRARVRHRRDVGRLAHRGDGASRPLGLSQPAPPSRVRARMPAAGPR